MPYISISNVRIEEVRIESSDREFAIVELLESGGRIRIRKSRIHESREELEKILGFSKPQNKGRSPADYFH